MIAIYFLSGVVIVCFIIWLLLPGRYHVSRSIQVNSSMEKVFCQVSELRNWEKWSPWFLADPSQKIEYSEPSSGQGAFYHWVSSNRMVDKGTLTLREVIPGKKIVQSLQFAKWGESTSITLFEQTGGGVKVSWEMDMVSKGWGKFFGPVMKKNLGQQFEQGLAGIKREAEK